MQVLNRGLRWPLPFLVMISAGLQQASLAQPMGSQHPNTAEQSSVEKSDSNRMIEQIALSPCAKLERGTSGLVIAQISQPGHYCLMEDFHARIEFADHAAEGHLISIVVGDVVLDLQGHTLGRGRIFKNPGGYGIEILDPQAFLKRAGLARNILIKNGVIQDFETGVSFANRWPATQLDTPTYNPATNTYHFPANNITLENITFKNNKKDFDIRVPPEPKK